MNNGGRFEDFIEYQMKNQEIYEFDPKFRAYLVKMWFQV
jgi:hypothetical protein